MFLWNMSKSRRLISTFFPDDNFLLFDRSYYIVLMRNTIFHFLRHRSDLCDNFQCKIANSCLCSHLRPHVYRFICHVSDDFQISFHLFISSHLWIVWFNIWRSLCFTSTSSIFRFLVSLFHWICRSRLFDLLPSRRWQRRRRPSQRRQFLRAVEKDARRYRGRYSVATAAGAKLLVVDNRKS